jgi:uncharacterized protein YcgI (DUF1989 family)
MSLTKCQREANAGRHTARLGRCNSGTRDLRIREAAHRRAHDAAVAGCFVALAEQDAERGHG